MNLTPTEKELEWMVQGTCSSPFVDPDMWFPTRSSEQLEVVKICQKCPVVEQCFAWTVEHDQNLKKGDIWGVCGALSSTTRRALLEHGCEGLCLTCKRPIRPRGKSPQSVPKSVAKYSTTKCMTCYQTERKWKEEQKHQRQHALEQLAKHFKTIIATHNGE